MGQDLANGGNNVILKIEIISSLNNPPMTLDQLAQLALYEPERGILGKFTICPERLVLLYSGGEHVFSVAKGIILLRCNKLLLRKRNDYAMKFLWIAKPNKDGCCAAFRVCLRFSEKNSGTYTVLPATFSSLSFWEKIVFIFTSDEYQL
jgi:hypothetical protein